MAERTFPSSSFAKQRDPAGVRGSRGLARCEGVREKRGAGSDRVDARSHRARNASLRASTGRSVLGSELMRAPNLAGNPDERIAGPRQPVRSGVSDCVVGRTALTPSSSRCACHVHQRGRSRKASRSVRDGQTSASGRPGSSAAGSKEASFLQWKGRWIGASVHQGDGHPSPPKQAREVQRNNKSKCRQTKLTPQWLAWRHCDHCHQE